MPSTPVTLDMGHRGPLISLSSWIMMVVMCISVLLKVASKFWKVRALQGDDCIILAAMVTAVCSIVATSEQVAAALGQHAKDLSTSQIEKYQKAEYTAQILYLSSLGLAKTGSAIFMKTLARTAINRALINGMASLNIAWVLAGVIGIAFQCQIAHTWAILSNQCFNQPLFWNAIGSFDVLIDVMLIAFPVRVVWDLQMSWSKKALVIGVFALRILVIPLTILRLVFLTSASKSLDHTYDDFNTVLITEFGMTLGIIMSCLPFLKAILDDLQAGVLTPEVRVASGLPPHRKTSSYALRSLARNGRKSNAQTVPDTSQHWLKEPIQHDTSISAAGDDEASPRNSYGTQNMYIRQKTSLKSQQV
ncbi:hypothetical protein MMC28_001588 [Mycoblastus sanguinarius]|nr:hypothetical protein [Mycoblastus sanguinarius]